MYIVASKTRSAGWRHVDDAFILLQVHATIFDCSRADIGLSMNQDRYMYAIHTRTKHMSRITQLVSHKENLYGQVMILNCIMLKLDWDLDIESRCHTHELVLPRSNTDGTTACATICGEITYNPFGIWTSHVSVLALHQQFLPALWHQDVQLCL